MEPQKSQSPQKSTKGYGKRSMRQWVLIYLVIAIVVYGLIYLVFIRNNGTSYGNSNNGANTSTNTSSSGY